MAGLARTGTQGRQGAGKSRPAASAEVSHNLLGQKLGRKGRQTRERILTVAEELIAEDPASLSLSAVARRVPLGMTSLYNYFADLSELVEAVIEPVMASGEEHHLRILREYWPDEDLGECCARFVHAFHAFWSRHSNLLHLRNSMADTGDKRILLQRIRTATPTIWLLVRQMDGDIDDRNSPPINMATVLYTGIERLVTVATDVPLTSLYGEGSRRKAEFYLEPGARLMEMAIRDARQRMASSKSE